MGIINDVIFASCYSGGRRHDASGQLQPPPRAL